MDLNEIAVFLKVVQLGSFSKAARALQMPNSTVSSRVASLERRLGLTLIQRTTRTLTVTAVGRAYFENCLRGVREFEAAEAALSLDRAEPHGPLRMTAPVDVGTTLLPEVLTGFAERFPRVRPEVILTDRRVDLLGEGVDLAIRVGELADSSLVIKRLADAAFVIYAAPKFLADHPAPLEPEDLIGMPSLRFTPLGNGPWQLRGPSGPRDVHPPVRMRLNDLNLIKTLAISGLGLVLLPSFFVADDVRAGRLRRVLPAWSTRTQPFHFVYPAARFVPRNVSAFIEHGTAPLRKLLTDPHA